jgi:hypothetical protein
VYCEVYLKENFIIYGLVAILEGYPPKNTKIKNSTEKMRPIWLFPVTCCLFLTAR